MPLPQNGLRSSREKPKKTMKEVKKKWTWQMNVEEDEFLCSGRETSGHFNAGLTPCSHTTTTRVIQMSPSLGFICIVSSSWSHTLLLLSLLLSVLIMNLNTLPWVSTQFILLVVVVCEHGVSPALKSPEVSLPQTAEIHLLPRSSVMFISSSLPSSFSLFAPSNFAVLFGVGA